MAQKNCRSSILSIVLGNNGFTKGIQAVSENTQKSSATSDFRFQMYGINAYKFQSLILCRKLYIYLQYLRICHKLLDNKIVKNVFIGIEEPGITNVEKLNTRFAPFPKSGARYLLALGASYYQLTPLYIKVALWLSYCIRTSHQRTQWASQG